MRWLQMANRYAIFSFFFNLQFFFMIINLKMVLLNLIFFFFLYCWKINGILSFFYFFYVVKQIQFVQMMPSLELYTSNLNISKTKHTCFTWSIMGSSLFVWSLQSPCKAVCGISAGRIKLFPEKLLTVARGKSQRRIH